MVGHELQTDHPGFQDEKYKERRKYFANLAFNYKQLVLAMRCLAFNYKQLVLAMRYLALNYKQLVLAMRYIASGLTIIMRC